MALRGTTRAYKRMKNGMFSSEIASRFKKTERYTPTDNSSSPPPPPRTDPTLINITFATHAPINEIRTGYICWPNENPINEQRRQSEIALETQYVRIARRVATLTTKPVRAKNGTVTFRSRYDSIKIER